MKLKRLPQFFSAIAFILCGNIALAQTTITIGAGTSSSSTRGPLQRSDTNSTTVYSRFVHVYTASELAAAGLNSGVSISALNWELASDNIIVGAGNANLKVYIKNSVATTVVADTWINLISGSSLVVDNNYNTTNNFPGASGWMAFNFNAPFSYTGGSLEIAVDWDCSQVSTPVFSGDGSIKWRWESTAPNNLVVKKTSSSAASTTIDDIRNERSNIQIVYSAAASCAPPTGLTASTSSTSASMSWSASANANTYNWKLVVAGAGSSATAIASGTTANTTANATGLTSLTSYDLYVEADCGTSGTSGFAGPFSLLTQPLAQASITVGAGTSSSSTRGPIQRSDTNSTTVYSRFVHVYTASELAAAGLANGASLTALNWELASDNIIIGSGNANFKVYIKNSSATSATADTWINLTTGSSLVVDNVYNTSNNFPGATGWMAFNFNMPFTYTGGALEIAVDWDCSQLSTPSFSGDGSLKWFWESTAPSDLVVKKTSSSSPASTIDDIKNERANIQIVFESTASCDAPTALVANNITIGSVDIGWTAFSGAVSNNWKVVVSGAGVGGNSVASGSTANSMATATGLIPNTAYDAYVQSDCGSSVSSAFAGPLSFTTNDIGLPQFDYVSSLNVSPNPSKGRAELNLELVKNAQVKIAIYSLTGQLIEDVYDNNVNQLNLSLDLENLREGLYFVRIAINEQSLTRKLILIH